jgi:hypothetical protein
VQPYAVTVQIYLCSFFERRCGHQDGYNDFCIGTKQGKILLAASNQANLIVGGLQHCRHEKTRQTPFYPA